MARMQVRIASNKREHLPFVSGLKLSVPKEEMKFETCLFGLAGFCMTVNRDHLGSPQYWDSPARQSFELAELPDCLQPTSLAGN